MSPPGFEWERLCFRRSFPYSYWNGPGCTFDLCYSGTLTNGLQCAPRARSVSVSNGIAPASLRPNVGASLGHHWSERHEAIHGHRNFLSRMQGKDLREISGEGQDAAGRA